MRKRSHHSGVFIIGIAFLVFIVVGITISLSIRACARHKVSSSIEESKSISISKESDDEPENATESSSQYTMSDTIAWFLMPERLEGIPEMILRKTSYIVSYNQETKLPNWVAWHLTADHTDGPYKRLANFHEDEDVPQPRATPYDYRGCGWSRGHMCPAGDNKWDSRAMYDTFSLTNVCPQNASLNSGLWNSIEISCRNWARKFGGVFIVCGPILMNGEHETIGNNQVIVPEAFFKVVLCLTGKPKGIGFIVRNTEGTKKRDLYYNSIDQVERITGIDFFPSLPDDIEDAVESEEDINEWN